MSTDGRGRGRGWGRGISVSSPEMSVSEEFMTSVQNQLAALTEKVQTIESQQTPQESQEPHGSGILNELLNSEMERDSEISASPEELDDFQKEIKTFYSAPDGGADESLAAF